MLDEGSLVCTACGVRQFIHVGERPGERDWLKNRSVHTYRRWMEKRLRDRSVVWEHEIRIVVQDFHDIVSVLRKERFIKRNVSRYDFYILRICSRRGIKRRVPRTR